MKVENFVIKIYFIFNSFNANSRIFGVRILSREVATSSDVNEGERGCGGRTLKFPKNSLVII